jgi:hypothetical protein
MKKLIATVATAGLLVVGGAGTAFAADTGGSGTGTSGPAPATAGPLARHPALRQGLRRAVVKISADTIGIDVKELRTDLRNGQSIAQVAQSKNVDPKTVVDAIVKAGDAKIDSLSSSGKINAERAAKMKDRLPTLADRVVNRVPKHLAAPDTGSASGNANS